MSAEVFIKRAKPGELSTGDFVRWNSSGGTAQGRIDRIVRDGTINVPDSDVTINGDEDDPAALITVYRETDDGNEATDVQVGHRFSTLTKIAALRSFDVATLKRAGETEFKEKEDRVVEFSFSSEYPVERGFGLEVLSHEPGAANLQRLNDGAPLLFNHDMNKPIGVVERAYLDKDKKKAYSRVRFSQNPFAQEVLADVRDGIMRNISVGYRINEMEERNNEFVATNWEPYEISVVSVPADPQIGVGRSLLSATTMDAEDANQADSAAQVAPQCKPDLETKMSNAPDLNVVRDEATKKAASAERARIRTITQLCAKHEMGDLSEQLIENGSSIDAAREAVLDKIGAKPVQAVAPVELNQGHKEAYAITDGIRALITGDWSSHGAGFVRELSQEVARSSGVAATSERSFFVPYSAIATRGEYSATGNASDLIATNLLSEDYIDVLRAASPVMGLGVRTMTGLVGDVAIPRMSEASTVAYLSTDSTAITPDEAKFDQVTMTPKNIAALSKYTRQTLLQATPGIEQLIRDDLTRGINIKIDDAIINGTGSAGQPLGIRFTDGINVLNEVASANTGATLTDLKVPIELETLVMSKNASGPNMAYVTSPKLVGILKQLKVTNAGYLWNQDLQAIGRGATPATLNGYPVAVTSNMPTNLPVGNTNNCTGIVFGDFSQAMVGLYGNGLEITVGNDGTDFSKALTSVRAIASFDVAIRHPEAFAFCGTIKA